MKLKHHKEIIAWANGEVIQYYDGLQDAWFNVAHPKWVNGQSYRVRPKSLKVDAEIWGEALNKSAWKFTEVCPEKSTLLFNSCKAALREAIITYIDIVEKENV